MKRLIDNHTLVIVLALLFLGRFVWAVIDNLHFNTNSKNSSPHYNNVATPIKLTYAVNKQENEYDVLKIYQGTNLDDDTKVITDEGIKEGKILLTPIKLTLGKYVVNVTRKFPNVYKVDGKGIFIETRYCYEYSYSQQVILVIESTSGSYIGKMIF